jgi:hypothetical protein
MNLKSCHSTLLATVFFALLAPLSALAQDDRASFDSENAIKEIPKHDQETPSGQDRARHYPARACFFAGT